MFPKTFLHRFLLLLTIFSLNPSVMQTRAVSEEEKKTDIEDDDKLTPPCIDDIPKNMQSTTWFLENIEKDELDKTKIWKEDHEKNHLSQDIDHSKHLALLNFLIDLFSVSFNEKKKQGPMPIESFKHAQMSFFHAAYKGKILYLNNFMYKKLLKDPTVKNLSIKIKFLQGALYAAIEGNQLPTVKWVVYALKKSLGALKHTGEIPQGLFAEDAIKKEYNPEKESRYRHVLEMIETPNERWKPLHFAILNSVKKNVLAEEIIHYLLSEDISVNQRNSQGKTAFHLLAFYAKHYGSEKFETEVEMWDYLRDLGGDPAIEDIDGHNASYYGSEDFKDIVTTYQTTKRQLNNI
ncbi:MAG: hypothetical protein AAF335_03285 [Bacteroidota bacterium]